MVESRYKNISLCEHLQQDMSTYEKDMLERGQKSNQETTRDGQKTREQIRIAQSAVQKHLKTLQAQGHLFRIGLDKGCHWKIQQSQTNPSY